MKIRDFEWWIVAWLAMAAFILAIWGFDILYTEASTDRNFRDLIFHALKLFTGELGDGYKSPLPWQLEIARWLAPGVFLYTAGKAILYLIRREYKSFFLRFKKDHVIVSGLNDQSQYLIEDLLKNGKEVIILAEVKNPQRLALIEQKGAMVREGDINSAKFLRSIAAHKAKYFVFLDPEDEKNISDAISVYTYLGDLRKARSRMRLRKQVLFTHVADDIKLKELLDLHFFDELQSDMELNRSCEIRIFSMHERTARVLFNEYAPDTFKAVHSDSPQLNVAIVGSGPLAISMILRLASLAHYINFQKLKVTLFHEGELIVKKLLQNLPGLEEFIDLVTIDDPLELFDIETFNAHHHQQPFQAVYLLCENDSLASNVLKKLIRAETEEALNVILCLRKPEGILNKWYKAEKVDNIKLIKFNITEETFTEEALISEELDRLAQVAHEVYLSSLKERIPTKNTHQDWPFLAVDAKNQNREQADHIYVKLRAMGCKAVDKALLSEDVLNYEEDTALVEKLAKMEHNRWWANKRLAGWRYGEKEEGAKRLHPDLVPYEELDEATKEWDRRAVRNMRNLLDKAGLKIVKV